MNWMKRSLLACLLVFTPILGTAQTLVNCASATPCTMAGPSNTGTGDRAWLAFGKINADLLILAPLFNSTGLPFTLPVTSGGTGATTLTGLVKGNGTSAFTGGNLSGDCTTSGFVVTCTKTNGVSFATSATTDTTNAANIASGQLPSLARLPSIANNTLLSNVSGSTAAPTAVTFSVLGLSDTPLKEGAVGDGIANDTTPVQNCVNTLSCALPANICFKVTSPIQVPTNGWLVGQGNSSCLKGSSVVGGVVQIGTGSGNVKNITVSNFSITGSATYALKVDHATSIRVDHISASDSHGATAFTYGFWFDLTFDDWLTNLDTFGSVFGGTATFTAPVGGATSGTLTAAIPNGKHPIIFSNGDQRIVTVTGGTTATWPVALTAGTVTTATYGVAFFAGGAFNANISDYWQTSSTGAYCFYFEDINGYGNSNGNTFDGLTAQGCNVGVYVGGGWGTSVFNGIYSEGDGQGIILGSQINNKQTSELTFNSPGIASVSAGAGGFINPSNAALRVDFARAIVFNSPSILAYQYTNLAPVTITRNGADSTGIDAAGVALVTPAGVVKATTLWRPGRGYTATPTATIGGTCTGATATATFGTVATFTGTTTTDVLTVTAVASGSLAPGVTLSGGGITAGTYLTSFGIGDGFTGTGGVGTYHMNNSGSWSPTTASAITSLNLTAGGSACAAGYAPVSVGNAIRVVIIAPHCQFDGGETPLWPMIVQSSTDNGQGGIEIVADTENAYPGSLGSGTPIPVGMKRAYAPGLPYNMIVTYDAGAGAVIYKKYTLPSYP